MALVIHRPDSPANRTERQMAEELSAVPGLLFLNVYLAHNRKQRELDGLLLTPEGLMTLEAKADPRHSGELTVSRNDDWRIGGEVADFSGSTNPLRQTREGKQILATNLKDVPGLDLPRVDAVTYVAGDVTLGEGTHQLGDVNVAVSGHLARGVQEMLNASAEEHRRRLRLGSGPLVGTQDVRQIAALLDLPVSLLPSDEVLEALGFPAGSSQEVHAAAAARRAAEEDERFQALRAQWAREKEERERAEREQEENLEAHVAHVVAERFELPDARTVYGGPGLAKVRLLGSSSPLHLALRVEPHPCSGATCEVPIAVTVEGRTPMFSNRLPSPLPHPVEDAATLRAYLKEVVTNDDRFGDEWLVDWASDPLPSTSPGTRARESKERLAQRRRAEQDAERAAQEEARAARRAGRPKLLRWL